ncbi:MAG: 1-acyl-sn-glycerol-3-phosphate acyltransferase [Candidatus Eremiobacteraeota bacterium]|nr:1-acyl-sn-glycerol-3-phosphate acyltransferase [Candidatus Eremiobacteraeota bacterium]
MSIWYHFAAHVVLPPVMQIWRLRSRGRERVPMHGPLIVACNHSSYLDPVALGVACPRALAFMAKAELFEIPILGPIITAVNAYPVDRRKSATAAIKKSVEILREGRAVGIFPQGTRVVEGEGQAKGGVALLASLAGAPVLPAYVSGGAQAAQLHQIKVAFGTLLTLPAERKATREDLSNFTQAVMREITALGREIESRAN